MIAATPTPHRCSRASTNFRTERGTRKNRNQYQLSNEAAAALRHERRQRDSAPIIAAITTLIDQLTPLSTLGRDMAKHLGYTRNPWIAITRFVYHHDLQLDNNTAERALRPVVVGSKKRAVCQQRRCRRMGRHFLFTD